jgi:methionyl-tRNA formyltransferase
VRIVFMGTPEFAVPSLFALSASGADIACVYTRPDAASGRGRALRAPAVKLAALELGVTVRQPASLREPAELEALELLQPELIVVAAYGLILPADALNTARGGAVNVHASLLPRWRGAAPVQRAILAGDEVTGVSIMRMEQGLDTGPYCLQVSTDIDGKTAGALTRELAEVGARALLTALPAIADGSARWQQQDLARVTYAEKVAKSEVQIDPSLTRDEAQRRIRASMPGAPCRVLVAGRGLTLLDAAIGTAEVSPGVLAVTDKALVLGVADGAVEIGRVKPDGKSEMEARAWARGVRDLASTTWERAS